MLTNPYRLLGIALALAGAILSPIFYFIVNSVPLTAVGMSAIILGSTCIMAANARPYLSPEACQILLRTGIENTSALLEELNLRNKAIYLPAAMNNGHARALVPLLANTTIPEIRKGLPSRLIVRYGPGREEMAIAVTTPGSVNLELLPDKPGPTADEIESALNYLLTGVLDIARSATVHVTGSAVDIEVNGVTTPNEDTWYYHCLGSPIASIAAAITAEALGKPIRIKEETAHKGKNKISLEVLS